LISAPPRKSRRIYFGKDGERIVILIGGGTNMPLTHDFKETIRARAQHEPKFRQALLREAVLLRDYVNATIGFQALEEQTNTPVKSLMRMLEPKGSPSAAKLSSILTVLQKTKGVHFEPSLRR
jgi:hypothetical protein